MRSVSDLCESQTCRTCSDEETTKETLTKIKFPVFRFPRQQTRKTSHLVAADLVTIDVIIIAVTERPQVICLVFPLDLTKSVRGRRGGSIENGVVEMLGFDLDVVRF